MCSTIQTDLQYSLPKSTTHGSAMFTAKINNPSADPVFLGDGLLKWVLVDNFAKLSTGRNFQWVCIAFATLIQSQVTCSSTALEF
jgi:hypothetical protein